ncbi:tRNA modification GTPase MnmE [Planctomycetes bacterium Pla163]|uniref:tRNA modification GTPase MnmE n=1 Tax=Rohdeia mirabilis TaxID=2528008 RepID=A0A518D1H3_9BACT|nr:tRNA modification GTPase MnmE [Planctomycetes bacterium Pla163]
MDAPRARDGFSFTEGSADTICAVASPPGGAHRAVIRVSGPAAADVAELLRAVDGAAAAASIVPSSNASWSSATLRASDRHAFDARLFDGCGEQPVLVLWMPGPASYTGDDVLELHLPGAPPLVEAALEAVLALGVRPARAGEFTRRAFASGRIDLARAEGVLELVEARSESERRAATSLLAGGLSERVERLREPLEELCSLCEASLDFDESETGHVPAELIEERAERVARALDEAVAWERARPVRVRSASAVLVGPPNAGKSSLFNRLTSGSALVGPLAGTTRDALAATLALDGLELDLYDLPGLHRADGDPLDRAAQELAWPLVEGADLVLVVLAADRVDQSNPSSGDALDTELEAVLEATPADVPRLLIWNRIDRLPGGDAGPVAPSPAILERVRPVEWVATAAPTGVGLDALRGALGRMLAGGAEGAASLSREVAARHLRGLDGARTELAAARRAASEGWPLDAVASTLRSSLAALDALTGRSSPEDLLDRIFARFCLGK